MSFIPFPIAEWNLNIRKSLIQGLSHKALTLFRQMKQCGIEPDHLTFPILAKACAKLSNLQYSQIIHTHVLKSAFTLDVFVQTSLVDMYLKCDQLDVAYKLFDKMPHRDSTSYNVMIMGFAQWGLVHRAFNTFQQMRFSGCEVDAVTIMGLTLSSSYAKGLNLLKAIHCLGVRVGTDVDVSVTNTWIAAYAKCNDLYSAEMVFYGIKTNARNVVSWNSMIAGYAHTEKFVQAVGFYRKMSRHGVRPDLSTVISLLSSCVQPEALVQALIGGYAEKGNVDEAFALFHSMEAAGEKPDLVTLVALLSACGHVGSLELGRWINEYAILNGFGDNVIVCNATMDMYSKCGSTNAAQEVFFNMSKRSIVSWTTMIAGYALNGQFQEALGLFTQMVESGFEPNSLTFLAVIQACTHAGFLEEGREYFDLMTTVYKISPMLEHYACMVDLLGRRGKVKEALEFIENMPVEPDAGVWGALLGACKTHNEKQIGEYVARHLFDLEPQAAVSYVVMANIYAAEGDWKSVAKIRATMKSNRVTKSPGQSLVRLNGKIHAFAVEDRCHPHGLFIYEVLDGLALQLKEEEI